MRFRLTTVLFVLLPLLSAMTVSAETIYYSSDGKPVLENGKAPAVSSPSPEKKAPTTLERMAREAEEAAAAGFREGETVKVVDGIIYRLYKEPDTGRYTFKLYRKVKKPEATPKTDPVVPSAVVPKSLEDKAPAAEPENAVKKSQAVDAEKPAPESVPETLKDTGNTEVPDNDELKQEKSWFRSSGDGSDDDSSDNSYSYDVLDHYLAGGLWALDARHSFLTRKTVLKKRTVTTGTGSVNDTSGVGVDDLFSTRMHEDSLLVRYGVTDNAEIYLKGGMVYASFSDAGDMELSYGAGFRLVLHEYEVADDSRFYVDLTGSFSAGSVKDEFTDSLGDTYAKDTDFMELDMGIGGRWTIRRLSFYGSCSFLSYSEDTVRTQLQSADVNVLTDEMEQQLNVSVMGGLDYRLSQHINVYMEYHLLNCEGLLAGLAYRF